MRNALASSTTNYTDGILIVHRGGPELDYLAASLSQRGMLHKYIRPYVNKGRFWEKSLSKLSRDVYQYSLGRRIMPDGIDLTKVVEVGSIEDFCIYAMRNLGLIFPDFMSTFDKWSTHLNQRVQTNVGLVASCYAKNINLVVGSYLVSLATFKGTSGRRILNYPSSSHRFQQKLILEENKQEPAFARTLPELHDPDLQVHLDQECELSDLIIVGSTFARDSHVQSGISAEKIIVVPYGADISLFSPKPNFPNADERPSFKVLFVGRISQLKGISYLLKAYQRFKRSDTTLILVGNLTKDSEIINSYQHLITHIPHVPRTKLAEIYRSSDVFVFPTLIEGMGLVVLEAMASGLPVIVTPNGPGDIVRDGVDGFIVPPRDIDAIVDRLEYFRTHPEQRIQMGKNARARAIIFNWENYSRAAISAIFDGVQTHPGLENHRKNQT